MKKGLLVAAIVAFIAAMSSCKAVDPCPAYGGTDSSAPSQEQLD